jgi:hypothetical protein
VLLLHNRYVPCNATGPATCCLRLQLGALCFLCMRGAAMIALLQPGPAPAAAAALCDLEQVPSCASKCLQAAAAAIQRLAKAGTRDWQLAGKSLRWLHDASCDLPPVQHQRLHLRYWCSCVVMVCNLRLTSGGSCQYKVHVGSPCVCLYLASQHAQPVQRCICATTPATAPVCQGASRPRPCCIRACHMSQFTSMYANVSTLRTQKLPPSIYAG